MYDLGIINGRVYTENGYINTNVFIKDGRISALSGDKLDCTEYVDADGAKVLPGLIDPHVHFSLTVGENTSTDNFETGSINGLLGGITTYIDFLDPIKRKILRKPLKKGRSLPKILRLITHFTAVWRIRRTEQRK